MMAAKGIVYYIGVAILEELFLRSLLLQLIEKLRGKRKNSAPIAVISASVLFGLGHVFSVLGQSLAVIAAKVIRTTAMGMYFGAIYWKTCNL